LLDTYPLRPWRDKYARKNYQQRAKQKYTLITFHETSDSKPPKSSGMKLPAASGRGITDSTHDKMPEITL
jgi:hypothetical protein